MTISDKRKAQLKALGYSVEDMGKVHGPGWWDRSWRWIKDDDYGSALGSEDAAWVECDMMATADGFPPHRFDAWSDNAIQFPRLIAEIVATQELDMRALALSMDLSTQQVQDLFDRAQQEWERIKKEHTN